MPFREITPIDAASMLGARGALVAPTPIELAFLDEVDDDTLAAVVDRAAQEGVTAERVLISCGVLDEVAYYRRLAMRLGLRVGTRGLVLDPSADPVTALRAGAAPLVPGSDAPRALFAPRGEAIRALIRRIDAGLLAPDSFALCSPSRFSELVHARFARRLADEAANGLDRRFPVLSARSGLDRRQIGAVAVIAALSLLSGIAAPALALEAAGLALWAAFFAAILLRTIAVAAGRTPPPPPPLADARLPEYSVIVPLYREAALVPQILGALDAIEYPRAKLDVKLAVEAEDGETLDAIATARPPPWIEIVVVPDGAPRTKPRALNFALASARGELTVIFDAEDVPQPDQLRRAAALFAAEPGIACLQARLVIHNVRESWLTRCFALEYAALFDFLDPGLAALGLPFGLGGTSNHFRTRHLRDLGGWDAWNVAEDADLGIRLSRAGLEVAALDCDTLEEAPADLANWFRQRVRWQKGWMQTLITHSRRPGQVVRELGAARAAALAALLISGTLGTLLWPFLAVDLVAHAFSPIEAANVRWRVLGDVAAYLVALAGAQSLLTPMIAAIRLRGLKDCRASLGLLPAYYLLVCAAAWVALYELVRRPFHWHKTDHRRLRLAIHRPARCSALKCLISWGIEWAIGVRLQRPPSCAISGALSLQAKIGCGCSSGVEHNLAKVGVEGSNPFARSKSALRFIDLSDPLERGVAYAVVRGSAGEASARFAFPGCFHVRIMSPGLTCSATQGGREDHRRLSNGDQIARVAGLAMRKHTSPDFVGCWQKHQAA